MEKRDKKSALFTNFRGYLGFFGLLSKKKKKENGD